MLIHVIKISKRKIYQFIHAKITFHTQRKLKEVSLVATEIKSFINNIIKDRTHDRLFFYPQLLILSDNQKISVYK